MVSSVSAGTGSEDSGERIVMSSVGAGLKSDMKTKPLWAIGPDKPGGLPFGQNIIARRIITNQHPWHHSDSLSVLINAASAAGWFLRLG